MNFAVILSGGVGTRMRSDGFPKQYMEVNNKPVLIYAVEPFDRCREIDSIVIVASVKWHKQIKKWLEQFGISKPVHLIVNGANRQESVYNGLLACAEHSKSEDDKVLIHEAVRPLVTGRIIRDCISTLNRYDSCLPVVPIHDTTYSSDNGIEIGGMVNRDKLCCGQAPESFHLGKYLRMLESMTSEERSCIRGCCELSLLKGDTVGMVIGDPNNFKLTRPQDLTLFKAHLLAKTWEEE